MYCQQEDCKNNCNGRGLCNPEKGVCTCFDTNRFGGKYCETVKCPNNCSGKGQCLATGACKCDDGYYGPDCAPRNCKDNCHFPNGECLLEPKPETIIDPRTGNKTTIMSLAHARGKCKCHPMFDGETCAIPRCPHGCSGNGVCDASTLTCQCNEGFGGRGCQYRTCKQKCLNGGHCVDGKCVCAPNFKGDDCSEPWLCPHDCHGKGACRNGKCYCKAGWEGIDCSQHAGPRKMMPPTDVKSAGCSPDCDKDNGLCVFRTFASPTNQTGLGRFECACRNGFTGPTCGVTAENLRIEIAKKEVLAKMDGDKKQQGQQGKASGDKATPVSTTCTPACSKPGGVCVQVTASSPAQCICKDGYSGATCDVPPPNQNKPTPTPPTPAPTQSANTTTTPTTTPTTPASPTPSKTALVTEGEYVEAPTSSSSSSSSSTTDNHETEATPEAPAAMMEVGATAYNNNNNNNNHHNGQQEPLMYENSEAWLLASQLEADHREDAMLLQALDQLIDY